MNHVSVCHQCIKNILWIISYQRNQDNCLQSISTILRIYASLNAQYSSNAPIYFKLSIECAHVMCRRVRPLRPADTRSHSRKHRWEENNRSNPLYFVSVNLSLSDLFSRPLVWIDLPLALPPWEGDDRDQRSCFCERSSSAGLSWRSEKLELINKHKQAALGWAAVRIEAEDRGDGWDNEDSRLSPNIGDKRPRLAHWF